MHILGVIAALCALSSETEAGGRALAKDIQGIEIVHGKKQDGGWQGTTSLHAFLPRLCEFHVIPIAAPVSGPNAYLPASSKAVKPSDVTGVVSIGLPPEAMRYWS
ncbi:hypothetical protein BDP27DRAFT_1420232 [Rhodocollybia butyracea]|uniref:Uncharacterized protein n=1 Tax=Rhodocollybia butyracea TaxID=206335 RepID=A0A9P5PQB0_9AGAR|nr:hypothetical protein BDP27DRAFT_1420232 [Rhodocollybia butyracea]